MFEEITALHEQVREYVEQLEPGYKVVKIEGCTTTDYKPPLDQQREIHPEYIHVFTDMHFKVLAAHTPSQRRLLTFTIYVVNDKLVVGERVPSIFF